MKGFVVGVSLLLCGSAWAQDADQAAPVAEAAPASEGGAKEPLPEIGSDQLAVFVLQRGFYFSSDLGVFLTFGGVNGLSNVQPYLGLKAGLDVNDFLSVQLAFSQGYSSGNPISENDLPGAGGQETANYGLTNFGAEVVGAIRPTERIAIEPKLGGGLSRIYPALTSPSDPTVVLGSMAPHVAAGVDLKYLTLLTDFTAGISLSGYYIIGPNIPALGAAGTVRYTF